MSLSGDASLKVIFVFTDFNGNFDASEVSSFTWTPCNACPQLCFFIIQQLSATWHLAAERPVLLLVEWTESSILAEVGWKATYLFSLWYLSWLASQSIYYVSIIQATGIQLSSNYMEFHKVLCFLSIIQKILYLEEQKNRNLFRYKLHLKQTNKKISWWMFLSPQLLHFKIICFLLKWGDRDWTEWRALLVSAQVGSHPYVAAWAVCVSRVVLTSVDSNGCCPLAYQTTFFFPETNPIIFYHPYIKGDL